MQKIVVNDDDNGVELVRRNSHHTNISVVLCWVSANGDTCDVALYKMALQFDSTT